MGEVWAGVHRGEGVAVAVKVVTGQGASREEFVRLFRNEVRAVAALDHPGIVLVFDMGAVDAAAEVASDGRLRAGSPYLVMEMASRGSLERYLPNATWPIVRHILFKVLDALAHAHARGMVHRDLKPQNILVGCAGSDPLGLKIADFGLAHPLDLTGRTGKFEQGWGTPYYMAPEQFRGLFRDYGPYTDLYALGVISWELTTGALPFASDNIVELSSLHLHGELPEYRPLIDVPQGFEGWVRRLLQKDFRDRFPSAAHAAYSLRRLLGTDDLMPEFHSGEDDGPADFASILPENEIEEFRGETRQMRGGAHLIGAPTAHGVADTTQLLKKNQRDQAYSNRAFSKADTPQQDTPAIVPGPRAELAEVIAPPVPRDWRRPNLGAPSPQLLGAGLGLFGLRTVRMVDRQRERDWLWEQLRGVHRDNQARLLILRGSTGTGKSRLARWLCERASEVGAGIFLTATHSEIGGPSDGIASTFARFYGCAGLKRIDIERRLERLLRAQGVQEAYEWRALTELISPFEGESGAIHRVRLTTNAQRYALLRRAVERVARKQPVIVWLDDVQWGADALGWANFLLGGADPTREPILLVATAHEDTLAERDSERALLETLAQASSAKTRHIEALQTDDTAELVRRLLMLEGNLAEQVEERSGGNPLFAVQLVGDWVASGKLRVGQGGFRLKSGEVATIPDEIHQIWRDRVQHVLALRGGGTREALELAAALGLAVDRAEWRRGCELYGLDVEHGLEECLFDHALASPTAAGWRFAHRMLGESLQRASREEGRWARLNSICADVLDEFYPADSAHAERRARYLVEAGRVEEAVESWLLAARYHGDRSDLTRAHNLLDRLEEILAASENDASGAHWVGEYRAAGWALRSEIFGLAGRFGQALKFADLAADAAARHDWTALVAPSLRARGRAQLHLGDFESAEASFKGAREVGEAPESGGGAAGSGLSALGLARVAQARGEFESAEILLHESRLLLAEAGDDQALARCYNALGDVARKTGRLEVAREFSQRARESFDAGGNQLGVADCLNDLAEMHHLLGEHRAAEELCAEALSLYESIGSQRAMNVRLNLAFLWLESAQFDRARRVAADAREYFERESQLGELAHSNVLLLACAAHGNDWMIWDELFEQADRLRESTGLRDPRIARACGLAATVAEAAGEVERAGRTRELCRQFQS
jgi:serine/threonine protein kinase/tetratricopeptide (TPR) repeat protein